MRYEYENDNKLDSIELTLAMGCPLNCHYCPQELLLNRYFENDQHRCHMMSFDTFKTILTRVKKGGSVCFSGMCEPFLNPQCVDMILYAYQQGFKILLFTTLVGLQKDGVEKLKGIEFDGITLHIPDKENNSKFIVNDEYLEILKLFQDNFNISSYSCHGTIHPLSISCWQIRCLTVQKIWSMICKNMNLKVKLFVWLVRLVVLTAGHQKYFQMVH